MATFVLIHGAWHGGWCWEKAVQELERRGHQVTAPDLPGHGSDPTPRAAVNLDVYAERVVDVLESMPEPVVLVGHSMGGMVITAAAERAPQRVRGLIYLCAFVPQSGQSMAEANALSVSALNGKMVPAEDGISLVVSDDVLVQAFYHDCSEADISKARANLVPQCASVLNDSATLTPERYGSVPRAYIECIEDQAIHIVAQREMAKRGGCDPIISLDTSHSPFFSAPIDLVDAFEQVLAAF